MKKTDALIELESNIKWFENRGATLDGYLKFYKDSHYPPKQIALIFEADKNSAQISKDHYRKLAGKHYGDQRRTARN